MSGTLAQVGEDGVALLGRLLAWRLRPGEALRLVGPVGAGKSVLARALIRARLRDPAAEVPSPSFTLVQTYAAPDGAELAHVDLYRLEQAAEAEELGLEELLADAIGVIEWPERLRHLPPGPTVRLAPDGAQTRRVEGPADALAAVRLLSGTGWQDAAVAPLAGDASTRRYWRLSRPDGDSAILAEGGDGLARQLALTEWLRARGVHAPQTLAADAAAGLLLQEDLGAVTLAAHLAAHPGDAALAYGKAAEVLAVLAAHPPAPRLAALDGPALAEGVAPAAEWYAPAMGAPGAGAGIGAATLALHAAICAGAAPVTALRDVHAENLIWRGKDAPLGVIDFQDAVAAHPAYDLASLLMDARRDVPEAAEAAALARLPGTDPAALALLGAQRNLRILGIFARLALRDGKPRYLQFLPRTFALVQRCLAHAALAPLAQAAAGLPAPTPARLAALEARCRTR